jgi:ATP-dependent Clp protease adaptor protein ClpS
VHEVVSSGSSGTLRDLRTVFVVPWDGPRRSVVGPDRRRSRRPPAHAAVPTVASTSTVPAQDLGVEEATEATDAWCTVVWNDPVNLMTYVTYVFRSYFGHPAERAEQLMLQVHHEGRAVVSHGNREQMEVDVQAMHGFGLWATMQPAGD